MGSSRRSIEPADVDKLRQLLSGTKAKVLTCSDTGYEASVERWSRAAEKAAGVAIVPSSAEDVSIAIKYANEQNLDVAVKGGGHSTAGASSTKGGLLIDLGGMRKVDVDTENRLLCVQGGALWGDVDDAAWEHGLATVGGTVADTGVGGLTLGGGYGHLSGQRGLVIDNLVRATVVTADGSIKKASRDENSDLYWAVQGAGQNFGVTTEFVLQAYPQEEVYLGTLIFPPTPETVKKVVAKINDLYAIPKSGGRSISEGRMNSLLAMGRPPDAGGQTILMFVFVFDGKEEECMKLMKPMFELGHVAGGGEMVPYPKTNRALPVMSGFRSSMKGAAWVHPIRDEFVMEIWKKLDDFLNVQPDAGASMIAWEVNDPSEIVAHDAGCFANRGYHLNSLIMPMWTKAENDQQCRQFARDLSNDFKKELEVHGQPTANGIEGGASVRGKKGGVLLYGNYDQYDEISKDIFGDNYPRLQQIKAKYDPGNMFNKLFPIQPYAGVAA